jgi:cell division protein FtsB
MRKTVLLILLSSLSLQVKAQTAETEQATLKRILERLEAVEKQNEQLMQEIQSLRAEVAQSRATAPVEDRLDVAENRIEEQAQTKVEASQRMPLKFSGIALFNTFLNSKAANYPTNYSTLLTGPDRSGATLGQSQLGIAFSGPELPWGGHVSGDVDMDFLDGAAAGSYSLSLRRGVINFDWSSRSISVGQDRPLISARQPDSLAEVVVPPLAGEGNFWLWQPQFRYVERFRLGASSGIDVAGSLIETDEQAAFVPSYFPRYLDPSRPALEGRVNLWHSFNDNARFDIASGFHESTTHVNGYSVPSRIATLDWSISPNKWVRLTGLFFGGRNMANLGGFEDGFSLFPYEAPIAVHGIGGWSQLAFTLTPRLTLNTFCGFTAPRTSDLSFGASAHTASCAANAVYRIAPNVLVAAEALQERFGYLDQPHTVQNHYDLAIGYLF